MKVADLLQLPASAAKKIAETAPADVQADAVNLFSRLNASDDRGAIKFLKGRGLLAPLRTYYETYKTQPVQKVQQLLQAHKDTLPVAAVLCAMHITNSVARGEPLQLFLGPAVVYRANNHDVANDDEEWMLGQLSSVTDEHHVMSVAEWAEAKRFLPKSVTSQAGYYSFNVTPYLREIADCFSVDSPVRVVDFMKSSQIGATVGVLENTIGYLIDHVKYAPAMLVTADSGLIKIRKDSYIMPMLNHSGLRHLIQASDATNTRRTGETGDKLEWVGGGYLVLFGAQNADKLKSISIMYLLEDEVDTYPVSVKKGGDSQKLAEARTEAFHEQRKIGRISTPLITSSSRVYKGYKAGDQRKFLVPCKHCGNYQELVFRGMVDQVQTYGLFWEQTPEGGVIPETVRYRCRFCGGDHINADKTRMLRLGFWLPTAISKRRHYRSYHINALYSPVGMYPWAAVAEDWVAAFDDDSKTARSLTLLQEFYNQKLGRPFNLGGTKVSFMRASGHRRAEYKRGTVPNNYAVQWCGSRILFLVCAVDVHKSNLAVMVAGCTAGGRLVVVDYWRFEDEDCTQVDSPVWARLGALLEQQIYEADDGTRYGITLTFIDASFSTDTVTTFTQEYAEAVHPILGRDRPAKYQAIKEFADFTTQDGQLGYRILVDHYKDRITPVLRREWSEEMGEQPAYHLNLPLDFADHEVKEFTAESIREKVDDAGRVTRYYHRPGNAANEAFDLIVYICAAVDVLAYRLCVETFELETVDWPRFYSYIDENDLFMLPAGDV